MTNNLTSDIAGLLDEVRRKRPLVHHITNYVTVNDCANIVLAIGASPIMADDIEEVSEITAISSALVLNIGTLNERTVASMLKAGKTANEKNIPVVLDPVGAGASGLRNRATAELIGELKLSVLRGNMSEIRFIAGLTSSTKGVDASQEDMESGLKAGIDTARELAERLGCVVAITGKTDIVSDKKRTVTIENGHQMLSNVTGTGCMATSLVGACCGAAEDNLLAAVSGIASMGIAGELAFNAAGLRGNSSFRTAIIDSIGNLNGDTIIRMARIYEK